MQRDEFPRLVFDNSSSDSGTPIRSASFRSSKSRSGGMRPRLHHCSTALGVIAADKPSEIASSPPSFRTISPAKVSAADRCMGTNSTPDHRLWQGHLVPMPVQRGETAHDIIFSAVNSPIMDARRPSFNEWRQARIDRLSAALKVMGWSRDKFREEIHTDLGMVVNDHTWDAWWKPSRDRYPDEREFAEFAEFLGLSLDWFSGIRRWSRDVINPNRAFASAILNRARQQPAAFPEDPFDLPEPGRKVA